MDETNTITRCTNDTCDPVEYWSNARIRELLVNTSKERVPISASTSQASAQETVTQLINLNKELSLIRKVDNSWRDASSHLYNLENELSTLDESKEIHEYKILVSAVCKWRSFKLLRESSENYIMYKYWTRWKQNTINKSNNTKSVLELAKDQKDFQTSVVKPSNCRYMDKKLSKWLNILGLRRKGHLIKQGEDINNVDKAVNMLASVEASLLESQQEYINILQTGNAVSAPSSNDLDEFQCFLNDNVDNCIEDEVLRQVLANDYIVQKILMTQRAVILADKGEKNVGILPRSINDAKHMIISKEALKQLTHIINCSASKVTVTFGTRKLSLSIKSWGLWRIKRELKNYGVAILRKKITKPAIMLTLSPNDISYKLQDIDAFTNILLPQAIIYDQSTDCATFVQLYTSGKEHELQISAIKHGVKRHDVQDGKYNGCTSHYYSIQKRGVVVRVPKPKGKLRHVISYIADPGPATEYQYISCEETDQDKLLTNAADDKDFPTGCWTLAKQGVGQRNSKGYRTMSVVDAMGALFVKWVAPDNVLKWQSWESGFNVGHIQTIGGANVPCSIVRRDIVICTSDNTHLWQQKVSWG